MLTEEEKILAQSADYFANSGAYGYVDKDDVIHF